MELYFAQKVQQALEALCEDKSLKDRLRTASVHLSVVDSAHFTDSASENVKKAFRSFMDSDLQKQPDVAAQRLWHLIWAAAKERGREESLVNP